jgi:hypothetical protein
MQEACTFGPALSVPWKYVAVQRIMQPVHYCWSWSAVTRTEMLCKFGVIFTNEYEIFAETSVGRLFRSIAAFGRYMIYCEKVKKCTNVVQNAHVTCSLASRLFTDLSLCFRGLLRTPKHTRVYVPITQHCISQLRCHVLITHVGVVQRGLWMIVHHHVTNASRGMPGCTHGVFPWSNHSNAVHSAIKTYRP